LPSWALPLKKIPIFLNNNHLLHSDLRGKAIDCEKKLKKN